MTAEDRDQLHDDYASLYYGLLYWFYSRVDLKRSRLFADLLEDVMRDVKSGSIGYEERLSLIAEIRGDLPKAIRHRKKEIALIRRLHEISIGQPSEEYVMKLHGYADLSDRLDLLAGLYHEAGKRDKAIAILNESKAICDAHGVPFDGADLLSEYRAEGKLVGKKRRN